jgi:hypothetical protein
MSRPFTLSQQFPPRFLGIANFLQQALGLLPRHFHARWRLVRRRLLLLLSLLLLQVFGLRFLRLRGRLRCGLAFGLRLLFPLL